MNKIFQKENQCCKHEFLMNLQLQYTIIMFQFNIDIKEICKVTLALGLVLPPILYFNLQPCYPQSEEIIVNQG
jgi:hypothetical protein